MHNQPECHKRTHVERKRCTPAADPLPRERIHHPDGGLCIVKYDWD